MRTEAEIREARDTFLRTLDTVGLEQKHINVLRAAVDTLNWALKEQHMWACIDTTLWQCKQLLKSVEDE